MTTNDERARRERRERNQLPATSSPTVPATDTLAPLITATTIDYSPPASSCDPGPSFSGSDCGGGF